jgi:DNA-binding NtrC family response regulator
MDSRVLIVDDDADLRQVLTTALQRMSLRVDEASDGREAMDLLTRNSYAVVLLDLLMPVADGFSVLDGIATNTDPAPVVLVITGAEPRIVDELDARRIHGIVRKPFDPVELAGIVADCVELRSRRSFEAMAIATVMTGAPLMALLKL